MKAHNGLLDASIANPRSSLGFTVTWTLFGTVVLLMAPMTSPGVLLLAAVAPVWWYSQSHGWPPPLGQASTTIVTLGIAGMYLLIASFRPLSEPSALAHVAVFFTIVAVLYMVLLALPKLDEAPLRAMSLGFYYAMVLAGAMIFLEVLTSQWVRRLLLISVPWLRGETRDMIIDGRQVIYLEPYLLNRSISALAVLYWPAALAAITLATSVRSRRWMIFALTPSVMAIFCSVHATSKLAFVGAATMFAVFRLSPVLAGWSLLTSWVAVILLVVPLAWLAFSNQLYNSSWLFGSAQERIVIWGHTSQQVTKAPILGAGIGAARELKGAGEKRLAPGSTHRYLSTSLHSHNVYLQAWFETGAIGAFFLLTIGVLVLRFIAKEPMAPQGYLLAAFTSCALLGASSFSLWAPWFMSLFAIVVVYGALGAAYARRTAQISLASR